MSGLLPTVPGPGDGRYAAGTRGPLRAWTPAEDAALWPPLLACESERAYIRTCTVLVELLDRMPQFASGRPTAAEYAAKAVSLIERRTVTESLGGRNARLRAAFPRLLPDPYRAGRLTTWAERNKILFPWFGQRVRGDNAADGDDVAAFTGRALHDFTDGGVVGRLHTEWKQHAAAPDPGDPHARVPAAEDMFAGVFAAAVADFAALPVLEGFCL